MSSVRMRSGTASRRISWKMGVDLHTIQRLLGHTSIQTTMRYVHVARTSLMVHGAPIELLSFPSPPAPASPA